MTETKRRIENYPHLTLTAVDRVTLEEFTLYALPMRLFKFGETITPTVEVWDSRDKFEQGFPSGSNLNFSFPVPFAEVKDAAQLAAINDEFLKWLGVTAEYFEVSEFDINLTTLSIKARAQHKTNINKEIKDATSSLEEFEGIKNDYPALVQAYVEFVLGWARAHDARLVRFK